MELTTTPPPAAQWSALQPGAGRSLINVDLNARVFVLQPPPGTLPYAEALSFAQSLQAQRPQYGIASSLERPLYLPLNDKAGPYVRRLTPMRLTL